MDINSVTREIGAHPQGQKRFTVLPLVFSLDAHEQNRNCSSYRLFSSLASTPFSSMTFMKRICFRKVYAESVNQGKASTVSKETAVSEGKASTVSNETAVSVEGKKPSVTSSETEAAVSHNEETDEDSTGQSSLSATQLIYYEFLARKYIQREPGMERIKMIFEKNHKGDSSPEMESFKLVLLQVFTLSFFIKYIPSWFHARNDFIRENRGTVFRTRYEAARRMQDHVFLVAGRESAAFSSKVTLFSTAFLVLSQCMSSYNNKSSVLDYGLAAGITGGLARLSYGLKGIVSGTVVGSTLGFLIGGLAVGVMRLYGFAQEDRHLEAVVAKLIKEKTIIGEEAFEKKATQLLQEPEVS